MTFVLEEALLSWLVAPSGEPVVRQMRGDTAIPAMREVVKNAIIATVADVANHLDWMERAHLRAALRERTMRVSRESVSNVAELRTALHSWIAAVDLPDSGERGYLARLGLDTDRLSTELTYRIVSGIREHGRAGGALELLADLWREDLATAVDEGERLAGEGGLWLIEPRGHEQVVRTPGGRDLFHTDSAIEPPNSGEEDDRRKISDQRREANALWGLGGVAWFARDLQRATEHFQRALAAYQQIGDRSGEANALWGLGTIASSTGNMQLAEENLRAALTICQEINDRRGEANALRGLGSVALATWNFGAADAYFRSAHRIDRQLGDRGAEVHGLDQLSRSAADLPHAEGYFRGARAAYGQIRDALMLAGGVSATVPLPQRRETESDQSEGLGYAVGSPSKKRPPSPAPPLPLAPPTVAPPSATPPAPPPPPTSPPAAPPTAPPQPAASAPPSPMSIRAPAPAAPASPRSTAPPTTGEPLRVTPIDAPRPLPAQRQASSETRFLVAQLPNRVPQAAKFSMIVRVVGRVNDLQAGFAPMPALEVPDGGARVTVVVQAPHSLTSLGELEQIISVPASGDSAPVRFSFQAREVGLQRLQVTAWAGGTFLAQVDLEVSVEVDAPYVDAPPKTAPIDPIRAEPGEVTLQVRYDGKSYTFQLHSDPYLFEPVLATSLTAAPDQAVERAISTLRSMAAGSSGYTGRTASRWMKETGVGLWNDMVPDAIKQQFFKLRASMKSFTIATGGDKIPWELLYPLSADYDEGFLVEQLPVLRRVYEQRRSQTITIGDAYYVVPSGSPANAHTEVDTIQRIIEPENRRPLIVDDLEELLGLIDSGICGTLHFVCHNTFDPASGSVTKLARGPFVPDLLNAARNRATLAARNPLIFFNACRSAGVVPEYTRMTGWAEQFMAAGAGAFVGTLWAVRDQGASRFAAAFYEALSYGETLGEAALQARLDASQDDADPTWLAYTVYGDPTAECMAWTGGVPRAWSPDFPQRRRTGWRTLWRSRKPGWRSRR